MGSDWQQLSVRQLVEEGVIDRPMDGNHGESHPKRADFVKAGIPFIIASDLHNGCVEIHRCSYISERQARALRKGFARTGDVLISHKATMGRTALVPELQVPFLMLTPQVTYYRVRDSSRLNNRYLKYYFDSPVFQQLFESWGHKGSTRAYLGITAQLDLPILIPPLKDQIAIARVLGKLDDKIELNQRMNETLEAMAQAFFRASFIDTIGNGSANSWQIGKFEQLATLSREPINPGESPNETFDHYSIPAFDSGRLPIMDSGEQIKSNKFVVPSDAVMISKLNPRIPRVWLPNVSETRRSISSTEFLLAIPKGNISREYLYGLFNSSPFLDVFATMVTGTSSSHQRVKPEYLLAMDVPVASSERIVEYTRQVKPLHDRVAHNLEESRTLAALRDSLLPKLLSGELCLR